MNKFEDFIVMGGAMPVLDIPEILDSPAVEPRAQDFLYVCVDCGTLNNYYQYSCEECEIKAERQINR